MNYFNYFTEIEDTFIRRRGKSLLLSPLDWALIESWKRRGVPLYVALRAIEKSFDSHDAKPRKRSVKSLFYCEEEVAAQYTEWLESQRGARIEDDGSDLLLDGSNLVATAGAASTSVVSNGDSRIIINEEETDDASPFSRMLILEHLGKSRARLGEACAHRDCSPQFAETLWRILNRLDELEKDWTNGGRPDAERLEAALTDLENLLERQLIQDLAPEDLEERRRRAAEQLKPYRARMDADTYEQTRERLMLKELFGERNLPRLSLFHL